MKIYIIIWCLGALITYLIEYNSIKDFINKLKEEGRKMIYVFIALIIFLLLFWFIIQIGNTFLLYYNIDFWLFKRRIHKKYRKYIKENK